MSNMFLHARQSSENPEFLVYVKVSWEDGVRDETIRRYNKFFSEKMSTWSIQASQR